MKKINLNLPIVGASLLALTACGGGGGGGDSINIGPVTPVNKHLGSISMPIDANGFIAAIRSVSADGKANAKEAVGVFQWMNNNANLDKSFLENYQVDIEGVTYNLKDAYNLLEGYKKAYYDGKESFWQGVINTGTYDDENSVFAEIKILGANITQDQLKDIGAGNKTLDDVKAEIIADVINDDPDPIIDDPDDGDPVEKPVDDVEDIIDDTEVYETGRTTETTVVSTNVTDTVYGEWTDFRAYDHKTVTEGGYEVKYVLYIRTRTVTNIVETVYLDTTTITYSDTTTKEVTANRTVETEEVVKNSRDGKEFSNWTEEGREEIIVEDPDDGTKVKYAEVAYDNSALGTVTPGAIKDANEYRTEEFWSQPNYKYDDVHAAIKSDAAWSRGWTGKGSTIVIADSGANITHTDLDNNIIATKNFLDDSTNVTDIVGHGTHVAGIAGAELNGEGMIGVAPDAKLMIAKVAYDNGAVSFSLARKAAAWGRDNGSVAINLSAETRLDNGFRNSIVQTGDGEYYSNHWYYGINGYNGARSEAQYWKTALGDEQVLVKAAGNAGLSYSAGMNQMATATDDNGNLILDGQMLIVGNWDIANNRISGSSNASGNVCTTYVDNVCKDAAKIKDYYILAPGTNIYSTGKTGNYLNMTGTSMAAPVVTGAIAVIHQMWPHMKGNNLVKLLTETADKTILAYDPNVHGQGLLDLDKATQPVGATGIPTTGRTNGGVANLSGGISGNMGNVAELSNVMVLDSYERDYYVDLSNTIKTDTRTNSIAQNYGVTNFYGNYGDADKRVNMLSYQLTDTWSVNPGVTYESQSYLGNTQSGVFGEIENSTTTYANFNYLKPIGEAKVYGSIGFGVTHAEFDKTNSMLESADTMYSTTWSVGTEYSGFGASISQPVNIESAEMTYNVPTARTLDGSVVTQSEKINFKTEREIDFTAYYKYNSNNVEFKSYVEKRTGAVDELGVGVEVGFKF